MIRKKIDIGDIVKLTDQIILKKNYAFSDDVINMVHNIWIKLSQRRIKRK